MAITAASSRAKLVAVTGGLSGEAFSLEAAETTIGRDEANTIRLSSPSVSRHHCVLMWQGAACEVRDLGSSNGTFVNSVQVTTRLLNQGDQIAVGDSVFLFVGGQRRDEPPAHLADSSPVVIGEALASDATRYLLPATRGEESREEQGLRALLAMSTAINALQTEDDLHRELLRLVLDLAPATEAAIVLRDRNAELSVAATRVGVSERPVHISRDVVRRVIEERTGVLTQRDGEGGQVLCAPLAAGSIVPGVIYLALPPGCGVFDEEHLQLVTALGRIAAIPLENVRRAAVLQEEADRLRADLTLQHNMVGDSAPMRAVYERISRVASADSTVLVLGETGTGKELAARAIHANSNRARRPFVAINCAALTETLLDTELFGHERGAFTGALTQKKGKLEVAEGGTLFLDEVGEMTPALQSKLLRVLQEREFERVGGTRTMKADVRVVSATNRSLPDEVAAGRFRQDLYFRLNVVSIQMPALRDRRADVPLLARHFLGWYSRDVARRVTGFSAEALACLTAHDWPGNIRELQNAVERAIVLGWTPDIRLEDLPEEIVHRAVPSRASGNDEFDFHSTVIDTKKRVILAALRNADGSYVNAAKLLGVHPNYLHRLVRNLNLRSS